MAREPTARLPAEGVHPAALAVLLPPATVGGAIVVMLLAGAAGRHPLWPEERLTMSEAVALRDLGALSELLDRGQDPYVPYGVRADVIRPQPMSLTPFEAAIAARRDDVIKFLGEKGIRPDAEALPGLICLARREGAADILTALESSDIQVDCEGIVHPW